MVGRFDDIKCVCCNTILGDEEDIIEEEFEDRVRKFCSEQCAEEFEAGKNRYSISIIFIYSFMFYFFKC